MRYKIDYETTRKNLATLKVFIERAESILDSDIDEDEKVEKLLKLDEDFTKETGLRRTHNG